MKALRVIWRPKSMQAAFSGVVSGFDLRCSGSRAAYFGSKNRALQGVGVVS